MLNLKNLFKRKPKKISQKDLKLLDDWEKGRYLRVDKDIDNKKIFEKLNEIN